MAIPLKNTIYDKIMEAGSITDAGLYKALAKSQPAIPPDKYNKILMDLEIMGLIKVAWLTKDERRIEIVQKPGGADKGKAMEKDYEASFPGFEK